MPTPLFSVLIANYNNARFICECLNSVLAQTYANMEVIIVDDASTDHSLEVIQNYADKHSFIHVFINSENKGVGYTKKRCVDEGKGELCGFVDPDDALTPEAVGVMVHAHLQNPEAALIYSNYYFCNHQLIIEKECKNSQIINANPYFFNDTNAYISHFASFKKEYYTQTEGINPLLKYAEDLDFYLKLYDTAPCLHLNQTLYHYRFHKNGLTTIKVNEPASYWRWLVMLKRAEARGISLEQRFAATFVKKEQVKHYLAIKNWVKSIIHFKTAKKTLK